MKKVRLLLVIGLLCVSLSSLAGEVVTNDTGEDATGLWVTFSEPVQITAFGDTLMEVDQTGPADEFVFSGGTVSPWGSHWLNWSPTTARVVEYEWLTGSTATLQGLSADQLADRPIITGDLLNPDYFAHPAYVMQGVSRREAVFALPLDGIEELAFYPLVEGVDQEQVDWSVDVSHPEGIGASIETRTLYIWGSNASWAGYGQVTLEAVLGDAVSSVAIPVAVFREDKTLINAEGEKDYFVPWSPELDINRILSVEEHMQTYNKDEGNLDRTIKWARWKKMERQHDVELGAMWLNSKISPNPWPLTSQFALVDVYLSELAEMGIDRINSWNEYYVSNETSPDIHPVYDTRRCGGGPPTKTSTEVAYIVNEAHRLGIAVTLGLVVSIGNPVTNTWGEICYASPQPLATFFSNYSLILFEHLAQWQRLGVDMVDLCPALSSLNGYENTYEEASAISAELQALASRARDHFSGPLYHGAHFPPDFFPGRSILYAPFWRSFDVIALSGWWGIVLSSNPNPTLEQLVEGWEQLIEGVFQPFQRRFNKPFAMWENGCLAAEGCAKYGLLCERMDFFDPSKPDTEEMVRYFVSHNTALRNMEGYYMPGWHRYPLVPYRAGGVRDAGQNTIRLKIDETIRSICSVEPVPSRIEIDGSLSDWDEASTVWTDPTGSSHGEQDILALAFQDDENYLYLRVEYASAPSGDLRIEFDASGDLKRDFYANLSDLCTADGTWWGNSHVYDDDNTRIGIVDSLDIGDSIELRINRRFIQDYSLDENLAVRLLHYNSWANWRLEDETSWLILLGQPSVPGESVLEIMDCGEVERGEEPIEGSRAIAGEHYGNGSYTPYLRTNPALLPLQPGGQYEVCFDYRVVESNLEGFEVLFFSPTGARQGQWVFPLRVIGEDGETGHVCLEGQLHNYSDYEVRWNVIDEGKIVIDNVRITDLASGETLVEEGFEEWQ